MKRYYLILFSLLAMACSTASTEKETKNQTIITAGGTITEIVYELGFGASIIATDITSTYPSAMQELPSIGYRNQIKAEGILALGPDILLMESGYLTADVVAQLEAAELEIHEFEKPKDLTGTYKLIEALAEFLEVPEKGKAMAPKLDRDIQELETYTSKLKKQPKMAFVMARGQENVFVAGEDTFAESLLQMAAITSVGKGFKDFIPLTPEALVSMDPEYLLFFESSLQSLGGKAGVRNIRGIEQTRAVQQDGILAFDGLYLSGFGPRVGKAALELAKSVNREEP
ncbi:iron complex transport system substrate-binding protein [Cyclobacterium lianum]|uniref:Iron complex transport system substrate-binding protein n=1 Tax=Cyclobacterium lianum TaxID=388280 RepID=A0A1M7MBD9_9BACT|nr:ABC transporter substrate-binding protein [Cyclobacterium lianum]SHM87636.1 iron complex transport system substrate-binding protein [Cyclobacterium lianum]